MLSASPAGPGRLDQVFELPVGGVFIEHPQAAIGPDDKPCWIDMLEGSGEATSDLVDAFNARLRYGDHAQYHPSTLEPLEE